ncbi:MAG: glycosyltransferase family protein [Spirochaetes bacterium]|nr:glycosyltransferase family protein [Spirochaetota bacterium]
MNKTDIIIQARTGSTRLPGKILKQIMGKTVLEHVIERVRPVRNKNDIIIATTTRKEDDRVVEVCRKAKAKYFRGSEDDVLSRYYHAARENQSDIIVRITSDCPLIDAGLTDEIIEFFVQHKYDVITNSPGEEKDRTYPRGLDVEIFSMKALETIFRKAGEDYEREHVAPYFYSHPDEFSIFYYKNDIDYSHYRWTLDTREDFHLIKAIYENLYPENPCFSWREVLQLFERKKELININKKVKQKKPGD